MLPWGVGSLLRITGSPREIPRSCVLYTPAYPSEITICNSNRGIAGDGCILVHAKRRGRIRQGVWLTSVAKAIMNLTVSLYKSLVTTGYAHSPLSDTPTLIHLCFLLIVWNFWLVEIGVTMLSYIAPEFFTKYIFV